MRCFPVQDKYKMENPSKNKIHKSLSFVPLPILDVVRRTASSIKRATSTEDVYNQRRRTQSEGKDPIKRNASQKVKVKQLDPSNPMSPWFRADKIPKYYLSDSLSLGNLFWRIHCKYGSCKVLGFRQILSKTLKVSNDHGFGYKIEKTFDNQIQWMDLFAAHVILDNFGKGLMEIGVNPGDKVIVFVDACFTKSIAMNTLVKIGAVAVPLSPDRRKRSSLHIINETEARHLITTNDWILRVQDFLPDFNFVKKVIVFQENVSGKEEDLYVTEFSKPDTELFTHREVESMGMKSQKKFPPKEPELDDPAFLIYTSGSTGCPKGVLWSYRSLVKGIENVSILMKDFDFSLKTTCIIAPVPSLMVMEFIYYNMILSTGAKVFWSSCNSLTSITTGCLQPLTQSFISDLELLRPDILLSDAETLNQIRKMFQETPSYSIRGFLTSCNNFPAKQKLENKHSWPSSSSARDQVTLKYRLFGGKLKVVLSGSARLSLETQEFLCDKLQTKLIMHHYSCAEACSALLVNTNNDCIGNIGYPLWGVMIRLLDWDEGGYRVTDKPYSRGEIAIGSDSVSDGYFKNHQLNSQVFFSDENGMKWVKTGDIGQVMEDGSFNIIDRKADLFTLQSGEHVSPTKIESELKTHCPVIDNIFVEGSCSTNHLIAIIRPKKEVLLEMAKLVYRKRGVPQTEMESFPFLCYDQDIVRAVLHSLKEHAIKASLYSHEIPVKIRLSSHPWSPESGLVTAALKLRRHQVRQFFGNDLRVLFHEDVK